MTREQLLNGLLHVIVFMLGAGIGSFLNVVIYRLPLGISVNNPRRSFCPHCKRQIPAWLNIPIFAWLFLRGRCAECGARIPFRYCFVEILTGVLFYTEFRVFGGAWEHLPLWGPVVVLYWIFTALLIAGTFIDFDHFILPHQITVGGLFVGLLGSYWAPQLMQETEHGRGLLISFVSACIALGVLWAVVELGKLAFGRVNHRPKPPFLARASKPVTWLFGKLMGSEWMDKPESWSVSQPNEEQPPVFQFGEKDYGWQDVFGRPSDRLLLKCKSLKINVEATGWLQKRRLDMADVEIKSASMKVTTGVGTETFDLEHVKRIEGVATELTIPREAMGFGDVLLLAMIGSFLGWKAVFFVIIAASVLGTVCAVVPRLIGKTEWSALIPFGPYLSCSALIWVFYGQEILDWYLTRIHWHR